MVAGNQCGWLVGHDHLTNKHLISICHIYYNLFLFFRDLFEIIDGDNVVHFINETVFKLIVITIYCSKLAVILSSLLLTVNNHVLLQSS